MDTRNHHIGAVVLFLFLLIGLIITIYYALDTSTSFRNGQKSVPAPNVWTTQQPVLVQNSAGVFALKEIEVISVKEFHFSYVFKSSHQGAIHVTAVSSVNGGQGQSINLSATVLSLGRIDDFSVGVIRIQYLNRVGQTITLRITSSEEGTANWQLAPLKQLVAEPHPTGGAFYRFPVDQRIFPEIIWSGPWTETVGLSMVAFFKNAASTRYIFLQEDDTGKITVISREECIRLVGEKIWHY